MKHPPLLFAAFTLSLSPLAALAQTQPAPVSVVPAPAPAEPGLSLGAPLVIGKLPSSGRVVIAPDPIAAEVVSGRWQPPKSGDSVPLPDGSSRTWQAAEFSKSSVLKSEAFSAGYADLPVDSAAEQVLILDASGHSLVYINGEPQPGDPYGNGWVRIPIMLHKGRNDLLFRGGRSPDLRVNLRLPMAPVYIDPVETTLPDLVEGQPGRLLAGLIIVNATPEWQRGWFLRSSVRGGERTLTPLDPLPPLSLRKVGFEFQVPAGLTGASIPLMTGLVRSADPSENALNSAVLSLRIRKPVESRRVTFRSDIDGTVQYYALRPAVSTDGSSVNADPGLPLIFTLHGASVEATGQADAYKSKTWANIVAPTNRRPFGFDWEDWGRLDALEVLANAQAALKPDPLRIYLTGHSMGGHGTWQIGAHFTPRFAAIAPSAGWISFWSYAGGAAASGATPVESILRRAASPSDTLALKHNYASAGVYILHGSEDDNVPVEQAREMRKVLAEFHPDFAYYERPGAGHWWGNECVDWPPLMQFLQDHARAPVQNLRRAQFTTSTPGVASQFPFGSIWEQTEQLKPSGIDLRFDPASRTFTGSSANVALLALTLAPLTEPAPDKPHDAGPVLEPNRPISVELDQQKLADVPWPVGGLLMLQRNGDTWAPLDVTPQWLSDHKGPLRSGLFKNAFTHDAMLVVGTGGTPEENAWSLAQARFDSETFWYRGNGSFPIVLDTEFDPAKDPDRNVILYGNASSNRAWKALLSDCPIQIAENEITAGDRRFAGPDLGCLLIRPRPGSQTACIGAVAGTGAPGMRLTSKVPCFLSGVGIPDWIILGPDALDSGVKGVRGCGFFGNDWTLSVPDSAWAESLQPSEAPPLKK